MRLFSCGTCGSVVHFDSRTCLVCNSRLGFSPDRMAMLGLPAQANDATPDGGSDGRWRLCANAGHGACNWLVCEEAEGGEGTYCVACRHDRTIPDLSVEQNLTAFRKVLAARALLFYSLLRWHLPAPTLADAPDTGLTFDFLAATKRPDGKAQPVMTGYAAGLITLAIDEADDSEREARRTALAESYRTLLGHFRHESGHYYWERLVRDGGRLDEFRAQFGDERQDYAAALAANYDEGPPADWQSRHVSPYAACHPSEDFAETWAHYIHIVDSLETAFAFGMSTAPKGAAGNQLAAEVTQSPYESASVHELVDAWVPLTIAVNALNRSMGLPDLYPFVLSDMIVAKLAFVHRLVHPA
ncbi:MAG: putative zinc-binding metallopeptidase [Ancalomicrobiaceae bacterium]|nr:putative zinc-binding metallopeptidase [Ancalomicrobiaceae bacterium]